MTSKERVIRTLNFKKPDRVPFNFWMDRRLLSRYENELGDNFRVTYYGADVIESFPLLDWPMGNYVERDGSLWFTEPILKDWGKVDELPMPDPNDPKVYDDIMTKLRRLPDAAIFLNIPGPLCVLHFIRLLDNVYYDMYDNPRELHKLIRKIFDIQNEVIKNVINLPITALYLQDDVACSYGLMASKPMLDEFVFDYFMEGIEMAKKAGKPVVMHSDGKVMDILDKIIEIGINAINPLQNEFNDFNEFKDKYHGKLAVYGGLENTKVIPDGTVNDVIRHVEEVFETLGKEGGLIMSSHDIPLHCPRENIEAMVEAIKKCTY
jgi:uroporphyrinogen decarboxylase